MRRRAVFLDRDGTIIEEENYLFDPSRVKLLPGAAEAIRKLSEEGYFIVMVSNQSGVARGIFPESAVIKVNQQVQKLLAAGGARLDAIYYCPHHPQGVVREYRCDCECRKPHPGMGLKAAKEHRINLSRSYMVGDKLEDVSFGQNCGMKNAFLVSTGHGTKYILAGVYGKTAVNICDAADMILREKAKEQEEFK